MGSLDAMIYGARTVSTDGGAEVAVSNLDFQAPLVATEAAGDATITIDTVTNAHAGTLPQITGTVRVAASAAGGGAEWVKITNTLVSTGAAIDGSKIAPDFGAQLITTTGGATITGTITLEAPNVATLGADTTLLATDPQFQAVDPTVAPYWIRLPASAAGLWFWIRNTNAGAQSLTVQQPNGTTLVTIAAGASRMCVSGATANSWVYF